ncbi:unknown [Brachyspira sp. CAG:484]|nr:unknown [Brachyspira sp. CAG:484]
MRFKAFTLAEVLITLSIIGIVAAMTLPTLVQKKQDKELISMTRKVYSDINNAFLLSQQDYGVLGDNSFLFSATDDNVTIAKNLAKYFNGAKVCEKPSQKGCSQYYYELSYATKRYGSDDTTITSTSNRPKIILNNGAIISVQSNQSGCEAKEYTETNYDENGRPIKNPDGSVSTHTYTSTTCGNLTFDVNGNKKPNQFGRDAYGFLVNRNKLKPSASHLGGNSLNNILTGKDQLEYETYQKGQQFEF